MSATARFGRGRFAAQRTASVPKEDAKPADPIISVPDSRPPEVVTAPVVEEPPVAKESHVPPIVEEPPKPEPVRPGALSPRRIGGSSPRLKDIVRTKPVVDDSPITVPEVSTAPPSVKAPVAVSLPKAHSNESKRPLSQLKLPGITAVDNITLLKRDKFTIHRTIRVPDATLVKVTSPESVLCYIYIEEKNAVDTLTHKHTVKPTSEVTLPKLDANVVWESTTDYYVSVQAKTDVDHIHTDVIEDDGYYVAYPLFFFSEVGLDRKGWLSRYISIIALFLSSIVGDVNTIENTLKFWYKMEVCFRTIMSRITGKKSTLASPHFIETFKAIISPAAEVITDQDLGRHIETLHKSGDWNDYKYLLITDKHRRENLYALYAHLRILISILGDARTVDDARADMNQLDTDSCNITDRDTLYRVMKGGYRYMTIMEELQKQSLKLAESIKTIIDVLKEDVENIITTGDLS